MMFEVSGGLVGDTRVLGSVVEGVCLGLVA